MLLFQRHESIFPRRSTMRISFTHIPDVRVEQD
jgi:hypothetical protein